MENQRITDTTKYMMLGVALFVDFIELLATLLGIGLLSGTVTTTFSWLIIIPWFWIKGVQFTKEPKMFGRSVIGFIAGFIPIVGALPEFTLTVWWNVRSVQREDAGKSVDSKAGRTFSQEKKRQANRRISRSA